MGSFSDRLRMAISNYAKGALSYKSFASLIDIPYRTLQNYISGERSPNVDALKKFAEHGININWLITGDGNPYNIGVLEKDIIDKIMIMLLSEVLFVGFSNKNSLFSRDERVRLISFLMSNNYRNIGNIMHELLDNGHLNDWAEVEEWVAERNIDALLDAMPATKAEMWRALQKVKEKTQRDLALRPFPLPDAPDEEIGQ